MIRRSVTIALPIEDRKRSYDFYQVTLGLKPLGEPAADGVPEPLQFSLDERTSLMLGVHRRSHRPRWSCLADTKEISHG